MASILLLFLEKLPKCDAQTYHDNKVNLFRCQGKFPKFSIVNIKFTISFCLCARMPNLLGNIY